MYLEKLILTNFKNYSQAEMKFSPRINCIVGNNGVGKTNILDAIHYLSLTKSFFNNIDSLSIRHSEDFFIIQELLKQTGNQILLFVHFKDRNKRS